MEKPKLEKMSFEFSQEGNCVGNTNEIELLTIECDSSLGIDNDGGCFYVLKTTTGWSIDDVKDLQDLIDRVNKVLNISENKVDNPKVDGLIYSDICSCNPKNGGNGVCGCTIANMKVMGA
jgi:hypothetical protein